MACSSDEPRYRLIAKDLQTVSLSFVELSVVRSGYRQVYIGCGSTACLLCLPG
jgi:hypothetical protein